MKRKKLISIVVMASLAAVLVLGAAFSGEDNDSTYEPVIEDFQPGNSDQNILNGGTIAQSGDVTYYTEDEGLFRQSGEDEELLTEDIAENINVSDDVLYYTLSDSDGNFIKELELSSLETSEVLSLDSEISQMYLVNSKSIYYLSDSDIYSLDIESGEAQQVDTVSEVFSFAPTEYGIIYATGELFDLDVYAGDTLLAENVTSYYTDEGYLLVSQTDGQYQVELEEAFQGDAELGEVTIYDTVDLDEVLCEGDDCQTCEEQYQELLDGEITLSAYSADDVAEEGYMQTMSTSQENAVLRARQQAEIKWTPLSTVYGWRNQYTFNAGTTYYGIPYGQPIDSGYYVPNTASFSTFASAVKNASSAFYTSRSSYVGNSNAVSTYYSSDCSSFVSYAWGISRNTTYGLPSYATTISNWSPGTFQIGDALNSSGHCVLITKVEYNSSGNITAVEITEQTPPICKKTRYGDGGSYTLAYLQSKYSGYSLLRYTGTVTYTPDPNVPLDGSSTGSYSDVYSTDWFYESVEYVTAKGLFNGTSSSTFSPYASMTRGQLVTVLGRMSGVDSNSYCYKGTIKGSEVRFRSSPSTTTTSNIISVFSNGASVTIIGESGDWYQVIYNGTTGYVHKNYVTAGSGTFSDVAAGRYYTGYIQWAAQAGIIDGYSANKFGPDDTLTREQMATILCRYASYCGKTLSATVGEITFTDSGSISEYARQSVRTLQMSGIIKGMENGSFAPQKTTTRAQVATMLERYHRQYA